MVLNDFHFEIVLPPCPLLVCSKLIHNSQWHIFCILKHMHKRNLRTPYYHRLFPVNSTKRSKDSMITFTIQIICSIFRYTMLYKLRQGVCTVKGRSSDWQSSKGWKLESKKIKLFPTCTLFLPSNMTFIWRVFSLQFYTLKGLVCKKGQQ